MVADVDGGGDAEDDSEDGEAVGPGIVAGAEGAEAVGAAELAELREMKEGGDGGDEVVAAVGGGGEWVREGLGRGLEERLEALMAVGPGRA